LDKGSDNHDERSASRDVQARVEAALARHQRGDLAEADAGYRSVLEIAPKHPDALNLLGVLRYQQGDLDSALELLGAATRVAPDFADAHCNLGMVLAKRDDYLRAEDAMRSALAINPSLPAAHNGLGNALLPQGDLRGAIAAYERASELAPDFAEALVNLANARLLAGRPDLAREPCARAIQARPDLASPHQVMGHILASLGDQEAATRHFRESCRIAPDDPDGWCCLGSSLEAERDWDAALPCYERALELDPDHGPALSGALLLRKSLCLWDGLDRWSTRFADGVRRGQEGLTPFIYLAEPSTPSEQLACARLWSDQKLARVEPIRARMSISHDRCRQRADERITVAYFSHDFRRHPTAYTKVGLFENHDRTRFRVLGYCNGPDDESDIRRRVIASFDKFTDVRGWPPGETARRIFEDGVDILVDLKGHTLEAPTEVFALKPAPIQVNYKGYPGTMGADFIDYIVVDEYVVPPGDHDSCAENVVNLPETYWVDDSRRATPATAPSRKELGLPEEGFVFCGFNNSYKIRPELFDAWMAILREVPASVLWIQNSNPNSGLSGNLRDEAATRGVDAGRIVFAPRLPLRQYLGMFTRADLFLDARPYNAHTTASDALWSGLPVLTCPGRTFAARVAGSMLRTLGLESLIAESMQEYRKIAVRLANDPGVLAGLRKQLELGKRNGPLYDTARLTRHMERAYLRMFEDYRTGRPAAGFSVEPIDGAV
jgi:predicted O-linked N-acetylglucosamine transferase (SPINDLY family)